MTCARRLDAPRCNSHSLTVRLPLHQPCDGLVTATIPTVCGTHRFRLANRVVLGVSELEFSASGEAAPAAEAHIQFLLYVMKLLRYLGAALLRTPRADIRTPPCACSDFYREKSLVH